MHIDQIRTLTIAELDQVSGGQHQCIQPPPGVQKMFDDARKYWTTQQARTSYNSGNLADDLAGAAGGAKT
jgi:hypothetical protein